MIVSVTLPYLAPCSLLRVRSSTSCARQLLITLPRKVSWEGESHSDSVLCQNHGSSWRKSSHKTQRNQQEGATESISKFSTKAPLVSHKLNFSYQNAFLVSCQHQATYHHGSIKFPLLWLQRQWWHNAKSNSDDKQWFGLGGRHSKLHCTNVQSLWPLRD